MARKNIGSPDLLELTWEPGKVQAALENLHRHIISGAVSTSGWYNNAKCAKKYSAIFIRIVAILALAVSGIIPILSQIYAEAGKPLFSPAWASVALAIAATLALFDRYFGFSSGWMRFVATEQQVSQLTREFQIEWEGMKAAWLANNPAGEPTGEQIQTTITVFKEFVSKVQNLVKQETDKWIQEFQSAISQIDDASKPKSPADGAGKK